MRFQNWIYFVWFRRIVICTRKTEKLNLTHFTTIRDTNNVFHIPIPSSLSVRRLIIETWSCARLLTFNLLWQQLQLQKINFEKTSYVSYRFDNIAYTIHIHDVRYLWSNVRFNSHSGIQQNWLFTTYYRNTVYVTTTRGLIESRPELAVEP